MIKNYLKVAFRNILKYKGYSSINILGLAIGMTCCLLILLYVNQELNYDTSHENSKRIYQLGVQLTKPQGKELLAQTMFPVAPVFKKDYPEVEKIARIHFYNSNALVETEGKKFFETGFVFADSELFDIFTFPVLKGKHQNLLANKSTAVITETAAVKYFGTENPIGQTIRYDDAYEFIVEAVIRDIPVNSHFHFDIVVSTANVTKKLLGFKPEQWGAFFGVYTYVLLPENVSAAALEKKIRADDFVTKYGGKRNGLHYALFLHPLEDIHLYSENIKDTVEAGNYISNLVTISLIGLFILIIAAINFINLSTARSVRRSKEVGMRKTLGAVRSQLLMQYLGESVIFALIAALFAQVLVELSLPLFSTLVGKTITFSFANNIATILLTIGIAVIIGGIAGIYPAVVLSSQKTITVLKGRVGNDSNKKSPAILRKILVTLQFAISIILIIGTLIINKQLNYFQQANLGFGKDQTIMVPIADETVRQRYDTLKQELKKNPEITGVTACMNAPIGMSVMDTAIFPNGKKGKGRFNAQLNFIDFDYIDQFGLKLIAGRNLLKEISGKKTSAGKNTDFIINETAARNMGLATEEAIGKHLDTGAGGISGQVVGVVKDFHIASLYRKIGPIVIMYGPDRFYRLAVKIKGRDIPATVTYLRETLTTFSTKYPFRFTFLDEDINGQYEAETQMTKVVGTFAFIAIFIACLGLFGMASFTAEQRRKEISVRKVLGASVAGIVVLLSKEFTRWVLVANIIAWPAAYYIMNAWLVDFPYRMEIGYKEFLLAGAAALLIALLTVSYQAIKAAVTNPVTVLKYE
ncbi:MAG: FtsX-like permease family protein [bacterium]|nr:FtsX-like permease family protein [bacterium]